MTRVLLLVGVVGMALAPTTAPAGTAKRRVVTVNDNYYLPAKLTVPRGATIVWRWPADAGDVHDVKLGTHPDGAKAFRSEPGSAGYSFSRRLTVPGRYRIVCTLHEEMTMTITVQR